MLSATFRPSRFAVYAITLLLLAGCGGTSPYAIDSDIKAGNLEGAAEKLAQRRDADPDDFDTRLALADVDYQLARKSLADGVLTLLRHPAELERLRGDRSLIPSAVEEILRFESPVQMTSRRAVDDAELAGRSVKAGDSLQLFLGAANRDPARFPDPDRFDIARPDNRHLAFGIGPHFCLGAALARAELGIALGHVLDRLPGLELTVDEVAWQPTIDFRGPLSLPVRWRPAGGR